MGLLQKLLGRRPGDDDGADKPDRSSDDDLITETDPEATVEGSPPETSSVLNDAAPLPAQRAKSLSSEANESTAVRQDDDDVDAEPDVGSSHTEARVKTNEGVMAPSESSMSRVAPPLSEWPGYPHDDEHGANAGEDSSVEQQDIAVASDSDTVGSTETGPEQQEPGTDSTVAASPGRLDDVDYFVPQRPRRELLDLDPPEPPPAEDPKPVSTALPLDVAGSPRAALRAAGVAVPHMQQIVRRGDVRLWAFGVRASEALGWWLQIRQVHEKTGWLPVLLGSADDWLDNGEGVLHEGENEIGRISEVDVKQLFEDKTAEASEPPRGVPILPTRGDSDFAVPKTDGLLGLVEAEHGWQIPALLPWKGSTNWELYGAEHASVLRRWHEQHEVELVSMTWDILELYVPNPPKNDDEVLRTAEEVYAYCPDLLAAGVPTLDDLAIHMVRSRAWYFRWA